MGRSTLECVWTSGLFVRRDGTELGIGLAFPAPSYNLQRPDAAERRFPVMT